MLKITVLLLILVKLTEAQEVRVFGRVTGEKNKPLEGANVVIEGSIEGSTSDSTGYFEFQTSRKGKHNIIFTFIGYEEKIISVEIKSEDLQMNVRLRKSEVVTEEIIVTASSFTSGQQSQVTITPLEIVRIPGSDGDLFRAITTFPGSNQVDEGSRITVRGGEAEEVQTILDLATLYHPFVFDDDFNTSSYTTINPWGLRGINFSSGGFSAKYGNALSAVLELKSYEMPQGTGAFLWLGLANIGLSGVYLSKDQKFGATFDAGQTILEPYFRLNGYLIDSYNPIPLARGFGGTLSYKPSSLSSIKAYFDFSEDKIGIRNSGPSYDGYFNSASSTLFSNIKFSAGIGSSFFLNAGLSFSRHKDNVTYGVLSTEGKNTYGKLRFDLVKQFSRKIELNTGGEYEYLEDRFSGRVPLLFYNLRENAPSLNISSCTHSGRAGFYTELQYKPLSSFFIVSGIRTDYHTLSEKIVFDPRISLGWKFSADHILRAAYGIYHQFPSLEYYARSVNHRLKPQQAGHYILGYEFNKNQGVFLFRVEGYYKDYRNLVLSEQATFGYNSDGKGYARGVDVFIKSSVANRYSSWISYSYTDSKRSQYNVLTESPSNYDITHNMTIVASYNITSNLVTGLSLRYSTGKPYTPVTGSIYDSVYNVYQPLYGPVNSERFPTYKRLDVNFQYIFSLLGRFAVAVFQINNVLNNKNLYDYTYNYNYTERKEIVTTNKRQFYLGLGIQF
ncbi:MAG: TonB-dependent receptor [Ignavibacteria bacterium]|nr:TonB-dependent receptor [Ignavibacteria bacterium]